MPAFDSKQWRLPTWPVAGLLLLAWGSVHAAAPCAEAERAPETAALVAALSRAETWAAAVKMAPAPDAAADPSHACRHYFAGGAAFFLSERTVEYAPRAVEQLLSARVLGAPDMDHVQARARLKTAFARTGALPGVQVDGPLSTLEIVTDGPSAAPFVLRPAQADSPRFSLPAPVAGATLLLPPGAWRVTVNGRCGGTDTDFTVAGGSGRVTLPGARACLVRVQPVGADGAKLAEFRVRGADGALLGAGGIPDSAGEVTVEARGHLPARLSLGGLQGEKIVPLARCPVDLRVTTVPPDARVTGAGPGAWGPRQLFVQRPGYRPVAKTLEVPAPAECAGATQVAEVALLRPVVVSARLDDGSAATLSVLTVDAQQVAVTGFALLPGRHPWTAKSSETRPAEGTLEIPDCAADDCPPVRLEVTLERARRKTRTAPLIVAGSGVLAVAGGLLAGAAAISTNSDIDDYSTKSEEKVPIETLITKRDEQARLANVLVGTGAAVMVGGLVWYWLGGD